MFKRANVTIKKNMLDKRKQKYGSNSMKVLNVYLYVYINIKLSTMAKSMNKFLNKYCNKSTTVMNMYLCVY